MKKLFKFLSRIKSRLNLLYLKSLLVCLLAIPFLGQHTTYGQDRIIDGAIKAVVKENNSYRVSVDGFNRELPVHNTLRLGDREFDPLSAAAQRMALPQSLMAQPKAANEIEAYVVQFHTQPFPEYQEELEKLGGKVVGVVHYQGLIVHMTSAVREAVEKLSSVRWVGTYHSAYKLSVDVSKVVTSTDDQTREYSLLTCQKEMVGDVARKIEKIGGRVHVESQSGRIIATLSGTQLQQVAQMPELLYAEPQTESSDDMNIIRELEGANHIETVAGYTGQGVRMEVIDDGVRTGQAPTYDHQDFRKNPPIFHPRNHLADYNHGTPVYGIVFGSGAGNSNARGLLPDAEQPIFASRFEAIDEHGGDKSRYNHSAEMVNPNGTYRSVGQTSSWGHTQVTNYTTVSAEMDRIIFDLDFLYTQSQSNTGNRTSRPEAWAKNAVAVGGIHNGGDNQNRADDYWQSASIGPANDGRIKPDLSNQYGYVMTTDDLGNTAYNNFGGTSGATPATFGCFGLLYQMWADGVFDGGPGKARDVFASRPHSTTARALMIQSAYQYAFNGTGHNLTRVHQGWGVPDVKNLYETAKANGWTLPILVNENAVITPLEKHTYSINSDGTTPLKVTMVYADPPGNPATSPQRINDLTLKVTSPGGTVYWGNNGLNAGNWSTQGGSPNTIDVVENVFIQNPEVGTWEVAVLGDEIIQDAHKETPAIDADYALVASGGTSGPTYTMNVATAGQGSVTLSPSGGTYAEGTVVTLTASPAPNWLFTAWSGDTSSTQNPVNIVMTSNKNVTATFSEKPRYTLNVNTIGQGSVTLTPVQPVGGYYAGTVVTLTATAATGYKFDSWSGDKTGTQNPTTITMNANKTVTATFSAIPTYTLTTNTVGQGIVSLNPAGGTYNENTVVTLTATPALGYKFDGWSGAVTGTQNPVNVTMNANKTVMATFSAIPTYTLATNIVGQGTVSLNPAGGTYNENTVVALTATPAAGYKFDGWSGAVTGTQNPVNVTMNANKTVTATFSALPAYTLTTNTVGQGTISLSPSGGTYVQGTVVSVTANAGTGYQFNGWSGDLSGTANPTSITLNANKTVTANFGLIPTEVILTQNTSGGDKMEVNDGQRGAQSFNYGASNYMISKVVVYLSRDQEAPTGDLHFSIGTGVNTGAFSGSTVNIAPSQVTNTSEGSSFTAYEIVYSSPVGPFNAGTTYYLNMENDAPNGKKYYFEFDPDNNYPNGTYFKELSDEEKDMRFQIWGGSIGNKAAGYDDNMTDMRIYPNPAKDQIVVEYNSRNPKIMEIRNITGLLLKTVQLTDGNTTVDISELKQGIYILSTPGTSVKPMRLTIE